METPKDQNFQSHARLIPAFHFFALPLLLINVIWRLVMLKNGISFSSVMDVLVAAAILLGILFARTFALSVQDRVIRLEEQVRLARLLPADLQPRIGEFTAEQLIGLRFCCDQELPALARQVLEEKVADRKTIKSRVKTWRPDFMRA